MGISLAELETADTEAGEERYLHKLYQNFVKSYLEDNFDSRSVFQPWEIEEEISPPYTTREIKKALDQDYSTDENVEKVEEELWMFIYNPDIK